LQQRKFSVDSKLTGGRIRNVALAALFIGTNEKGKIMAAHVLANELKLNLYRIDLNKVVSKYIGETEKNLNHILKEAEIKNWILFFDEADALFGKRTEVKDAHDRFAKLEVSYLLNRLEAYRGVAILSINKRSSVDDAFIRRIRYIVNFPLKTFK